MGNLIDGRAADRAADKKFVYLKLGLGKILGRAFSRKSNRQIFSSGWGYLCHEKMHFSEDEGEDEKEEEKENWMRPASPVFSTNASTAP